MAKPKQAHHNLLNRRLHWRRQARTQLELGAPRAFDQHLSTKRRTEFFSDFPCYENLRASEPRSHDVVAIARGQNVRVHFT
jgi:hypothetical protein